MGTAKYFNPKPMEGDSSELYQDSPPSGKDTLGDRPSSQSSLGRSRSSPDILHGSTALAMTGQQMTYANQCQYKERVDKPPIHASTAGLTTQALCQPMVTKDYHFLRPGFYVKADPP